MSDVNSFIASLGVDVLFAKSQLVKKSARQIFVDALNHQISLVSDVPAGSVNFNLNTKGKSAAWFSVLNGQVRTRVRFGNVNLTPDYVLVPNLEALVALYKGLIAKAEADDPELIAMLEAIQVSQLRGPRKAKVEVEPTDPTE